VQRRFLSILCIVFASAAVSLQSAKAEGLVRGKERFYYRSSSGEVSSARIIHYRRVLVIHPPATVDPRIDPRLRRAATIADDRASAHTKARCWRYVKEALLASGVIDSYPKSNYACDAGKELEQSYGFQRLPIHDPYQAPVGAVIVYGHGAGGAGHVELRTKDGFASDYHSKNKCYYPLLAIYGKFNS